MPKGRERERERARAEENETEKGKERREEKGQASCAKTWPDRILGLTLDWTPKQKEARI